MCKNLKSTVILLAFSAILVLASVVLFSGDKALAASLKSEKMLESGKSVSYNLDGKGAKETITWSDSKVSYDETTVNIKVNGKSLLQRTGEGFSAEVSIIDINENDKYKEFIIKWNCGDGYMPDMAIYQYRGGKLNSIYSYNIFSNSAYELIIGTAKTDGKGSLYWRYGYITNFKNYFSTNNGIETAYGLGDVKNVAFKLSGGKLKLKSTTNFTAETQKMKMAKTMQVYKSASTKSSKLCKAIKSSTVTVQKFKITGKNKGYIYVKTSSGKSGWIYVQPGSGTVLKLTV